MTAQGGDHGEQYPAHGEPPRPWEQYPHPPVDPHAPVNYPEFTPPYPPRPPYGPPAPPYGYPPAPPGGPIGYGGPPPYPGPYDPYRAYQSGTYRTNGLAVASLVTSIAGIFLGLPLAYAGLLIPIVGAVLGSVALSQIKRTQQPGRGLAIAGIVIGCVTLVGLLFVLALVVLSAAALKSTMLWL
jgi:hypothetical protein